MISKLKTFLFKNISPRQTITKNIFWLSASQIGTRIFRVIIIIYAARILGAAEYGVFSYVLGFAGFFAAFADIGINSLLTRDIAGHPEQRNSYFSTSFWIKMVLLFFTALLIALVAPHFSNIKEASFLIPFVALMVIFDGIGEFAIAFLRGMEKMQWEALILSVENIALMVIGFIFLVISPTSKSLTFSYIASSGLATLLAIFILRNQFSKIFRYFDKKLAYRTIKAALPIAFSTAMGVFMINNDMVMLGWWRTATEIGYYSVGQRIVPFLYILSSLFAGAIFPVLSRFAQQNEKEKEKNLNEKSMASLFLVAIPLVVGGIILAEPIIGLTFGQVYLPGVPAFRVLLATLLWIYPITFLSYLVLAHNQQKKIVKYAIICSLANVLFNVLLIPVWGIIGAAIATFVSQIFYVFPTWKYMKKFSDFKTLRHLKKIIVGAIIMGVVSFILNYFNVNVILNIIVSAGVYFGALYLFKEKVLGEVLILFKKFQDAPSQSNNLN
ncbi:MAG: flippase [bacterium]|nr:flippase [bacterium]